jgi:ribosome-binding protein aMBF1 (putative translation factor)
MGRTIFPLRKIVSAMIETARDFGDLVRRARRAHGLTQRELALVANVDERFIVDLEAGKPTCQFGKALMVSAILKLGLEADPRAFEARQSTTEIPEFLQGVAISASGRVWGEG